MGGAVQRSANVYSQNNQMCIAKTIRVQTKNNQGADQKQSLPVGPASQHWLVTAHPLPVNVYTDYKDLDSVDGFWGPNP